MQLKENIQENINGHSKKTIENMQINAEQLEKRSYEYEQIYTNRKDIKTNRKDERKLLKNE